MVTVPLIAINNQELQIVLDEQNCTIHLYQLGDYFYLDLYIDDDPVVMGAIVQPKCGIIQSPSIFRGQLYMIDNQNASDRQELPYVDGLGDRFEMVYVSSDECEEMELNF